MKRTLPYILFLLSFVGFSQEDSPVSVSLDTARIRLGEPVGIHDFCRRYSQCRLSKIGALGSFGTAFLQKSRHFF